VSQKQETMGRRSGGEMLRAIWGEGATGAGGAVALAVEWKAVETVEVPGAAEAWVN